MKNKILIAGVLAVTLVFICSACAVSQNSNSEKEKTNQGQQKVQQNESDESETDDQAQEGPQKGNIPGLAVAEQRRSDVANAVHEMLQVAERSGGIGQQVKIIAQTQTKNQEKLESCLEEIQSRSGFAKFMFGANYSEINNAENILEQNRELIEQLNQVKNQLANQDDVQNLTQQIQILEQANLEIENSLETAQEGFSMFGWLFRLFSS